MHAGERDNEVAHHNDRNSMATDIIPMDGTDILNSVTLEGMSRKGHVLAICIYRWWKMSVWRKSQVGLEVTRTNSWLAHLVLILFGGILKERDSACMRFPRERWHKFLDSRSLVAVNVLWTVPAYLLSNSQIFTGTCVVLSSTWPVILAWRRQSPTLSPCLQTGWNMIQGWLSLMIRLSFLSFSLKFFLSISGL